MEIRRRVLLAFEAAEREPDLSRATSPPDVRGDRRRTRPASSWRAPSPSSRPSSWRVISARSSRMPRASCWSKAARACSRRSIPSSPSAPPRACTKWASRCCRTRASRRLTQQGVAIGATRIDASTVLWAAGVRASPLCERLGLPVDRSGRVQVEQDCSVPGHPEVFVIGDAASLTPDGATQPLPGVSPVAMQQGRFVARAIRSAIDKRPRGTLPLRRQGLDGDDRPPARSGRRWASSS